MRKLIVSTVALLALSLSASADVTRTTTTTTYNGTVSDLSPSNSTIVLRSDSEPTVTKYVYNPKTIWVDSAGNTVRMDTVREQPVTIYYEKQGDQLVVTRVVSHRSQPTQIIERRSEPAKIIEQRTTTTTQEIE